MLGTKLGARDMIGARDMSMNKTGKLPALRSVHCSENQYQDIG